MEQWAAQQSVNQAWNKVNQENHLLEINEEEDEDAVSPTSKKMDVESSFEASDSDSVEEDQENVPSVCEIRA